MRLELLLHGSNLLFQQFYVSVLQGRTDFLSFAGQIFKENLEGYPNHIFPCLYTVFRRESVLRLEMTP